MKPRKPLPRPAHPIARHTPPPRGKRPKPRNPARHAANLVRAYGSPERRAWVKGLPCVARHAHVCQGPIDNVHVTTGGTGRKADARFIVAGCRGFHRELHAEGIRTVEARYGLDLGREAAQVEADWIWIHGG